MTNAAFPLKSKPARSSFFTINSLVFHRIVRDIPIEYEDVNISFLQYLIDNTSSHLVTIDSALNNQSGGSFLCLTFDDGYVSDWDIVMPLLLDSNSRATFFIVTDWINKPGYLYVHHIREMHRRGMQIGSHSSSHPDLLTLNQSSIRRELLYSRLYLEDLLGSSVSTFSVPFGSYDKSVLTQVYECGFKYCCTSRHGLLFNSSSRMIPRNSVHRYVTPVDLMHIANPTPSLRGRWLLEDYTKSLLRRLSPKFYIGLRSLISSL